MSINYSRFITRMSANRKASTIRELTKILSTAPPEMIPLSGGYPNASMFPFASLTVQTNDGQTLCIEGAKMKRALQYLPTDGLPELVSWLKKLQDKMHSPPRETSLVVTSGSQDGLCKAIEMLTEVGDSIVVEEYIYSGTLGIMNPYDPTYIVIKSDSEGMCPISLAEGLQAAASKPKYIYINPNGANPTGTVLSEKRRLEIYKIACEHDLIILEDDPYYYVQFSAQRHPTFLALDTEGRVLRFDSFSKVLSSGMRLGFVTGPRELIERINLHMQVSVLQAGSLSQVLVMELLNSWGVDGFLQHVTKIEKFYKNRRDKMIVAADKHLNGLCEWNVPEGGLFLWLKAYGIGDTWDMLMERGLKKNVMLVPGRAFATRKSDQACSSYLRAAFSVAEEKDFDEAFLRLASLIKEEQGLFKK